MSALTLLAGSMLVQAGAEAGTASRNSGAVLISHAADTSLSGSEPRRALPLARGPEPSPHRAARSSPLARARTPGSPPSWLARSGGPQPLRWRSRTARADTRGERGTAVLIKGPEVAHRYPDPALRSFRDVDVLVPDAPATQRQLLAAGFQETGDPRLYEGHPPPAPDVLAWAAALVVEIHHSPKWVEHLDPPHATELIAAAVPRQTWPRGILTLPAAHHAVLLAAHSWAHRPLSRLRDLIDIAVVASEAEPARDRGAWQGVALGRVWTTTERALDRCSPAGPTPASIATLGAHLQPPGNRPCSSPTSRIGSRRCGGSPRARAQAVSGRGRSGPGPGHEEGWPAKLGRTQMALTNALFGTCACAAEVEARRWCCWAPGSRRFAGRRWRPACADERVGAGAARSMTSKRLARVLRRRRGVVVRLWVALGLMPGFRSLTAGGARRRSATPRRDGRRLRRPPGPPLTVGFELVDGPWAGSRVLAWTTTPWTLPANLALAVGPDIDYAVVDHDGQRLSARRRPLGRLLRRAGSTSKPVDEGSRREPSAPGTGRCSTSSPTPSDSARNGPFRSSTGDFVSTEEGTGVVHMAPGFGEDDHSPPTRGASGRSCRWTSTGAHRRGPRPGPASTCSRPTRTSSAGSRADGVVLRHETYDHPYRTAGAARSRSSTGRSRRGSSKSPSSATGW